jgi:hypothetical protein
METMIRKADMRAAMKACASIGKEPRRKKRNFLHLSRLHFFRTKPHLPGQLREGDN